MKCNGGYYKVWWFITMKCLQYVGNEVVGGVLGFKAILSLAMTLEVCTYVQLNLAISNSVISNSLEQNRIGFLLDLPLFFLQSVTYYLELGYFEHPSFSNQPQLSWNLLRSEGTLVKISQEVQSRHLLTRRAESWEMYWRVHGNESTVRLTGLAAANAEGDRLLVFVNPFTPESDQCQNSPAASQEYDITQYRELDFS